MNVKRNLYIGPATFGTSKERFDGLSRYCDLIDSDEVFGNYLNRTLINKVLLRKHPAFFSSKFIDKTKDLVGLDYDIVWIDTPYVATRRYLNFLSTISSKIYLYLTDSYRSPGILNILRSISCRTKITVITTKRKELSFIKSLGVSVVFENQRISKSSIMAVKEDKIYPNSIIYAAEWTEQKESDIRTLINKGISAQIDVYGKGWKANTTFNTYDWLYGDNYFNTISHYGYGLGIQNRKMMDVLTTRILEIPASGSLLIADRFVEIESIFKKDILYFDNMSQINKMSSGELYARTCESQSNLIKHVRFNEDIYDDYF